MIAIVRLTGHPSAFAIRAGRDSWENARHDWPGPFAEDPVIDGLVRILLFQGIGEVIARFLFPPVPGPVIGLVLLLGFLAWRGGVPEGVELVSSAFMRYLGVLFVPAAVGVVMYWPRLQQHALAIAVALVVSVLATIAASALLAKWLDRGKSDAA